MGSAPFRSPEGRALVHHRYAALLDKHAIGLQRRTIRTPSGDTFVLAAGPGGAPPVLLLHGSGATAASWLPELKAFGDSYRLFAPDLPGEPGLSTPSRLPFTTDAHSRWLSDVMDELGIDRATVIGTSVGGWLAVQHAVVRPERVSRLLLVSPGGIGRRTVGPLLVAGLLATIGERGRRAALRLLLGGAGLRNADVLETDLGDLALTTFRHFRPRTDTLPVFTDTELSRLDLPVHAVIGAADRMIDPAGTAARLRALVPAATCTVLPGVGHLIPDRAALLADHLPEAGRDRPAGA